MSSSVENQQSAQMPPLLTETETPPEQPATSPLRGNPGIVGIPITIAGAFGLGLVDTGYVHAAAAAAGIPTIMTATAIGLLLTTVWAAALGQNAAASLFAVFFGFYGSYAALALGLTHNWYGIPADQIVRTEEVWLICWLFTIFMLTLATLRLPWSFTLLLGLVDVALVLLLIGAQNGNTAVTHAGGIIVFLFVAVAVYLYVDIMWSETGGKGLPLGKPVIS
jgi:succinate-acetate transporter protein